MVEDNRSPTGYGTRPLTRPELGELWDLPVLLKDLIIANQAFRLPLHQTRLCRQSGSNMLGSAVLLMRSGIWFFCCRQVPTFSLLSPCPASLESQFLPVMISNCGRSRVPGSFLLGFISPRFSLTRQNTGSFLLQGSSHTIVSLSW